MTQKVIMQRTLPKIFFMFLRLGMFETVSCTEDLPPYFQRKLNMLVTTNEELNSCCDSLM